MNLGSTLESLAFGESGDERVSSFGFRVLGFGFRVSGFGARVSGFGFRVSGFEFRVPGFRFQVSGFRFRDDQVQNFVSMILDSSLSVNGSSGKRAPTSGSWRVRR